MPVAKSFGDELPSAIAHWLARGELPPGPCADNPGLFDAFLLEGRWLTHLGFGGRRPDSEVLLNELRDFWQRHANRIQAATPPCMTPWVVRALAGDTDDNGGQNQ
jgi:hypothetical protein